MTLVGGTGSQLVAGWLMTRVRRWHGPVPLVILGGMVATLPGVALIGGAPGPVSATVGVLLANLTLGLVAIAVLFGWQQLTPEATRVAGNGLFFAVITVAGVGQGRSSPVS